MALVKTSMDLKSATPAMAMATTTSLQKAATSSILEAPSFSRRGFLGSVLSLLAAPAIVKIASIMPVKSLADVDLEALALEVLEREMNGDHYLFGWSDWRGIYGNYTTS